MKQYSVRMPLSDAANAELKEYPELLRTLLFYRGIDTKEKAELFLSPRYERDLHDPFLFKDMKRAVERILRAIDKKEKILIYSDYDADGIPAAVVMSDFFRLIDYSNVEVYIPHRHVEGYGLHLEAIETFKEKGIKLLITLDCGITDVAEVKRARELGIDVIVTDHHVPASAKASAGKPGEILPKAYAVINPKRADSTYPYSFLCGTGVAFKLVQALLTKIKIKDGHEKWLLDMVGLATLSDMVPLTGENRVLAHYGITVLRKSRRPGLVKLLSLLKINQQHLTEDDIGFMITPRINAASRMGVPSDAFKLLSTHDETEAQELAKHLDRINNERKGLVAVTVKEIKKLLEEREDYFQERKVIVLGNPLWRPALLGLAANTIAETYHKPVFLWGRENGDALKGSCRSDGSVNMVKLMEHARSHFIEFGGHAFSGGFSIQPDLIHTLDDTLNAAFNDLGHETLEEEPLIVDTKLLLEDVTWSLYDTVEKLAPFGIDNPKPLFLFENVVPSDVRVFGKSQDHLELTFFTNHRKKIRAIGFFMKAEDFSSVPRKGVPFTLIATLEQSFFGQSSELRLRIVDCI